MAALLQLQAVSKHYGALKAVDGVNVDVADGEALAVIGPNGAGKTTLFNLITGDAVPTKGRIEFGGSDVTGCRRTPARAWVSAARIKFRIRSRT